MMCYACGKPLSANGPDKYRCQECADSDEKRRQIKERAEK